ncbi:MAG: MauE/DoxX family redox-associated membrane protein [Flavisolibacter sp.]
MENLMMNERTHKSNLFVRIITFSWLNKRLAVDIIALLFVILFLYTGIAKLMEFDVFQEQLMDSPILAFAAPVVAWGLPITELIISILLFIPKYRLKGLYAALLMMILFTGYVGWLLAFAPELPCSCGGIMEALSWKAHLIVNIALIGLALTGIILAKKIKRSGGEL